jgi:hypothetical protein
MNKFKILKYYGYLALGIPTALFLVFVSGLFVYISTPKEKIVNVVKEIAVEKKVPVEKVVERTTTNNNTTTTTTTFIQQPQTPQIKSEHIQPKPESVIKKELIDTTKSHDTTSKK